MDLPYSPHHPPILREVVRAVALLGYAYPEKYLQILVSAGVSKTLVELFPNSAVSFQRIHRIGNYLKMKSSDLPFDTYASCPQFGIGKRKNTIVRRTVQQIVLIIPFPMVVNLLYAHPAECIMDIEPILNRRLSGD